MSKFCYSGVLIQASTKDSNEALIKILTSKNPLDNVALQTQDLQLDFNIVHLVAYISDSFSQSQCKWPTITKQGLVSSCPSKNVPFTYKMLTY